jgi:hypothetical protein
MRARFHSEGLKAEVIGERSLGCLEEHDQALLHRWSQKIEQRSPLTLESKTGQDENAATLQELVGALQQGGETPHVAAAEELIEHVHPLQIGTKRRFPSGRWDTDRLFVHDQQDRVGGFPGREDGFRCRTCHGQMKGTKLEPDDDYDESEQDPHHGSGNALHGAEPPFRNVRARRPRAPRR